MRMRCVSTGTASTPAAAIFARNSADVSPRGFHAEDDDIGLYFGRIEGNAAGQRQLFSQQPRIVVILPQPFRTLFERDKAGRGKDSRLPHAAAQHFADRTAAFDEVASADNHGAHWRAQPLAEAELHRVHVAGHRCHVFVQVGCGIEDASAVEMHMNLLLMRALAYLVDDGTCRYTVPPAMFTVFSRQMSVVLGR